MSEDVRPKAEYVVEWFDPMTDNTFHVGVADRDAVAAMTERLKREGKRDIGVKKSE